jgi:hypothetical protein
VETDPAGTCELLVGLPVVTILGVDDVARLALRIHIETKAGCPGCSTCGSFAVVTDRSVVPIVDLPCFGRPTRLVWHKRRWRCPDPHCPVGIWTEEDDRIGAPRMLISDSASASGRTPEGLGRTAPRAAARYRSPQPTR